MADAEGGAELVKSRIASARVGTIEECELLIIPSFCSGAFSFREH